MKKKIRLTEGQLYWLIRKALNEGQIGNDENGWPIYDMGCVYQDANFDEIAQIIGDCTGQCFKNYFFNSEQWDSNDLQSKVYFKFNDIDGYLTATVGGGYTIDYDEEDAPIDLQIWMGMGNYSVAEESANGHYDPWSDLSKDMSEKINWGKVESIISSYSIDSPTPEFLNAFDTGMEKSVLGYNRETSERKKPLPPQLVRNESLVRRVTESIIRKLNENDVADIYHDDALSNIALTIENDSEINEWMTWLKNALAKKVKRGLVPDRNYLANCSTVRKIAQMAVRKNIKFYEEQWGERPPYLSNAQKQEIRYHIADLIFDRLSDDGLI